MFNPISLIITHNLKQGTNIEYMRINIFPFLEQAFLDGKIDNLSLVFWNGRGMSRTCFDPLDDDQVRQALKLSDEERIALQLAVATVRLGAQHGEEALWKLGGEKVLRPTAVSVNIGFVDQNMSAITDAVMQRRTLNFDYKGEKRQVDPYGMLSRSGFWYLIGFDHLRKDQRVFRVDRIEGKVTASTIRAFKTPVGFDVAAAVPTEKEMMAAGDGEVTTATVLVDASLVAGVRNEFGSAAIIRERADGSAEFAIPCANMSAFRLWLFAMVESAEVLAPASVREQVMQWLEELAAGK